MNLGTDDPGLYEKKAFGIRTAADGTGQVHAQDANHISKGKIFGRKLFLRFLRRSFDGKGIVRFIHSCPDILAFFFDCCSIHMVFLKFMEKLHGLVGIFLCFCQDTFGFLVGIFQYLVPALIQPFLFGFQLFFQCFDLFFVCLDLCTFVFNSYSAVFQGSKYILKRFILFVDLLFCFFNDKIRQPKLGRYGKRITFAGNTDQQPIGRT